LQVVHLLGQLRATAIAGNDITSSCFYTLGVAVQAAGIFAPISITLVRPILSGDFDSEYMNISPSSRM
jgi:hypothetical protein